MTAQQIAFAVAAVLGGYLAWPVLPKLWSKFKPVPMPDPTVAPKDTHGNSAWADAMYVIRTNIEDAEGQQLADALDSYRWRTQMPQSAKNPKLTATFTPGTPQ